MAAKRKTAGNGKPDPKADVEKIVVPHEELTFLDGSRVTIKPWGYLQGKLMFDRLQAIARRVQDVPDADVATIVELCWDDVASIARDTVEMEQGAFEALTYEDVLELLLAVVRTSILREDGGGVLGKFLRLRRYGAMLLPADPSVSPKPSQEEAAAETPSS